jgi:hypothetical protein
MNEIPALDQLAARFDQAIARTTAPATAPAPRRPAPGAPLRRRIALVGVAAAIAVGAFAAGSYQRPTRAVAGAELSLVDGRLAVSYQQVLDNPGDVEDQLATAGVRVRIVEVPASPSLVGKVRWVDGETPVGDDVIDHRIEKWVVPSCDDTRVCVPWWPDGVPSTGDARGYEAGLLVPLDYDGETDIEVGRPAAADEPYDLAESPFAAGEPLTCPALPGMTVADARAALPDVDVPIRWNVGSLSEALVERVDPDGDGDIDDFGAAGHLVVDDAAYLTDHSIAIWLRLPTDPTPSPDPTPAPTC